MALPIAGLAGALAPQLGLMAAGGPAVASALTQGQQANKGFDFEKLLGLLGQLQGGQQQGPQFGPVGALPGVQQPGFRPAAGLLGGANFKRLNPQQALRASQRRSGLLG